MDLFVAEPNKFLDKVGNFALVTSFRTCLRRNSLILNTFIYTEKHNLIYMPFRYVYNNRFYFYFAYLCMYECTFIIYRSGPASDIDNKTEWAVYFHYYSLLLLIGSFDLEISTDSYSVSIRGRVSTCRLFIQDACDLPFSTNWRNFDCEFSQESREFDAGAMRHSSGEIRPETFPASFPQCCAARTRRRSLSHLRFFNFFFYFAQSSTFAINSLAKMSFPPPRSSYLVSFALDHIGAHLSFVLVFNLSVDYYLICNYLHYDEF